MRSGWERGKAAAVGLGMGEEEEGSEGLSGSPEEAFGSGAWVAAGIPSLLVVVAVVVALWGERG